MCVALGACIDTRRLEFCKRTYTGLYSYVYIMPRNFKMVNTSWIYDHGQIDIWTDSESPDYMHAA